MRPTPSFAAFGLALFVAGLFAPAPGRCAEPSSSELLLILDASGSMWGQIGGENKIVIARRVLRELVTTLPQERAVGLVAYGHREEGSCSDIELVAPLGELDRAALLRTVDGLAPKGKTPITGAIELALREVAGRDRGATVVLLSDGLETCGGDPCAAVRAARERGTELVFHVIGFDVGKEDVSSLECAAQAGGGLYLPAENADALAAALETAVALAPDVPAGRLSVAVRADGALVDAAVIVHDGTTGERLTSARTYEKATTNPRVLPLAPGSYDVVVRAVALRGDIERRFEVTIGSEAGAEGVVEREVDFSTGELVIGVTRNGALSDATYGASASGSGAAAASGRTYRAAGSNPARVRITAGTYDVRLGSVEISSRPEHVFPAVVVPPGGRVELAHNFESGSVSIGVVRGAELVDATVQILGASGPAVASGRTYKSPENNPKVHIVPPGTYRVRVSEIRGETRELTIAVRAGEVVERILDLAAP
jgi:Ca-activated chloride channel family protein